MPVIIYKTNQDQACGRSSKPGEISHRTYSTTLPLTILGSSAELWILIYSNVIGEQEAYTNTGIMMVGALRETGGLSVKGRDTRHMSYVNSRSASTVRHGI